MELISGSGHATLATGADTKIDLAPHWNTTEWGVFGDGGGGAADFGKSNTLEAVTTLTVTSTSAPTCVKEGFTGETNNLKLAATPALGVDHSPRWHRSRRTARLEPRAAQWPAERRRW